MMTAKSRKDKQSGEPAAKSERKPAQNPRKRQPTSPPTLTREMMDLQQRLREAYDDHPAIGHFALQGTSELAWEQVVQPATYAGDLRGVKLVAPPEDHQEQGSEQREWPLSNCVIACAVGSMPEYIRGEHVVPGHRLDLHGSQWVGRFTDPHRGRSDSEKFLKGINRFMELCVELVDVFRIERPHGRPGDDLDVCTKLILERLYRQHPQTPLEENGILRTGLRRSVFKELEKAILPDFVTLGDVHDRTGIPLSTLRKWKRDFPKADIPGGGSRGAKWDWEVVLRILQDKSGRTF